MEWVKIGRGAGLGGTEEVSCSCARFEGPFRCPSGRVKGAVDIQFQS